jgi:hypothetical protein
MYFHMEIMDCWKLHLLVYPYELWWGLFAKIRRIRYENIIRVVQECEYFSASIEQETRCERLGFI